MIGVIHRRTFVNVGGHFQTRAKQALRRAVEHRAQGAPARRIARVAEKSQLAVFDFPVAGNTSSRDAYIAGAVAAVRTRRRLHIGPSASVTRPRQTAVCPAFPRRRHSLVFAMPPARLRLRVQMVRDGFVQFHVGLRHEIDLAQPREAEHAVVHELHVARKRRVPWQRQRRHRISGAADQRAPFPPARP